MSAYLRHLGKAGVRVRTAVTLPHRLVVVDRHLAIVSTALEAAGLRVVVPGQLTQGEAVTGAIRRVKAGDPGPAATCLVERASAELSALGADLLVAGCTELPLILGTHSAGLPVVDPTATLARATVREALAATCAVRPAHSGSRTARRHRGSHPRERPTAACRAWGTGNATGPRNRAGVTGRCP